MRASLARRLFRTIFAIGLINVVVALIAVEFIYEDLEETILRQELTQEWAFIEARIDEAKTQTWRTALVTAQYVPDGVAAELPEMFAGRSPPFSGEVNLGEKSYLVSIERTTRHPGILYLSQDITLMEGREEALEVGMALLGACMLLIGMLLARIGTRRIVGPLHDLAGHLAAIRPGTSFARIANRYEDEELAAIAGTLNGLLDALEAYVRREKALVSMASHELRTPVAVIAGALDVLEQRNSLGEADRQTVSRIRRAADEMRADVEALLKLARRAGEGEAPAAADLAACVREAISELERSAPEHAGRISCRTTMPLPLVRADPALIRMLLRNLIQNAIRHTRDQVRIDVGPHGLSVADRGEGIPEQVRTRLSGEDAQQVPEDGLGLFIVRLICERLGWLLRIRQGETAGTVVDILFLPAAGDGEEA